MASQGSTDLRLTRVEPTSEHEIARRQFEAQIKALLIFASKRLLLLIAVVISVSIILLAVLLALCLEVAYPEIKNFARSLFTSSVEKMAQYFQFLAVQLKAEEMERRQQKYQGPTDEMRNNRSGWENNPTPGGGLWGQAPAGMAATNNPHRVDIQECQSNRYSGVSNYNPTPQTSRSTHTYGFDAAPKSDCRHEKEWIWLSRFDRCYVCSGLGNLLECPGCTMKACERCQANPRPGGWGPSSVQGPAERQSGWGPGAGW